MAKWQYHVNGMSCEHCVRAVTTEIEALDGVTDVHVELADGSVTFESETQPPTDRVRQAVVDAGYELVG